MRWLLLGAAVVAIYETFKPSGGPGLAGNPPCRTIHPDHPLHPYRNGVPAVWNGRRIR